MSTYTPFTYVLEFLPTGQFYYGSRTAKNCSIEDLWTTYFSSSKIVARLIQEHGKDAFKYRVTRTFKTKLDALAWECRFLTRVNARANPKFLNRANGDGKLIGAEGHVRSKEHARNLSLANKGVRRSEETRQRMRESAKLRDRPRNGNPHSMDARAKISANGRGLVFVNKDGMNKKVHLTVLDQFLAQGYLRGRIKRRQRSAET